MNSFFALARRDFLLAVRLGGGFGLSLAFFALVVVVVPLGIGPVPQLLARIAPGVLWVAMLLATLLTLDRLFQADFEDGSLEFLFLSPMPLEITVLAKCAAHWLGNAVPLIAAGPLFGVVLGMPQADLGVLLASMVIGTPALTLVGAIGAALAMGVRRGGLLTSLLVLPLYIPILIFGAGAVDAVSAGGSASQFLLLLGAMSLGAVVLAPLAAAAAIRTHLM